jgi:hypothetical protein
VSDHNLIVMRANGLGVPKYQKKSSQKEDKQKEPIQLPSEITVTIVCVTRQMPEAIGKLPTFQEALASTQRQSLQQGVLGNEHRILVRQLRRKFTQVPKDIVQQIEASSDIEQLDNWLDQIILANDPDLAGSKENLPGQNQVWTLLLTCQVLF